MRSHLLELKGTSRGLASSQTSLVTWFFWYTIAPGSVLVFPKVPRSIRFSRCPPARPRRAARSYIARTGRPRGRESGAPHFLHVPRRAPARARAPDGRGRRPGRGRGIRLAARDPCKEIVAPSEPRPASRAIGAEEPSFYENAAAPYVCETAPSGDRRPLPQKSPHITAPHARCGRAILMPVERLMPSDEGCAAYWSLLAHYLGWARSGNPAPGKYKPMNHKGRPRASPEDDTQARRHRPHPRRKGPDGVRGPWRPDAHGNRPVPPEPMPGWTATGAWSP